MSVSVLGEEVEVKLGLVGRYNVLNFLAAVGLAKAAGASVRAMGQAAESFRGVPGRLENIECGQEFVVLVDYAHTEDALRRVLTTLKGFCRGRLICVFGCGGDRDRTKRPLMAAACAELADGVVVTSDNPRGEDPLDIIAQIRAGFSRADLKKVTELPDRKEAIAVAIDMAGRDDVVLIAGKGHEDYQIVGEKRFRLDDRQIAREVLCGRQRAGGADEQAGTRNGGWLLSRTDV